MQKADTLELYPPWMARLETPFRRLAYQPRSILAPYVKDGMTVIEPGPALGFFTLELARLVGAGGRVIAMDVQPKMLAALRRRAGRAGVLERLDLRLVPPQSLEIDDLAGKADFVLAFAVVHEVPDPLQFFRQCRTALRPGGTLLFCEPLGHVTMEQYSTSLGLAAAAGFQVEARPPISRSEAALLRKA